MSGAELERSLKKAKCYLLKHGANHDKWYSPITEKCFWVPCHSSQEVNPKTLHQILKDAGLE